MCTASVYTRVCAYDRTYSYTHVPARCARVSALCCVCLFHTYDPTIKMHIGSFNVHFERCGVLLLLAL